VLVKTPGGKNEAETFFSTDITNSPTQIIEWFVLRWNIEVTFAETRAHLGIETQRQWSDKAIARTTPMLMVLLSILVLVAVKMDEAKKLLVQETTSWYDKKGELTLSLSRNDLDDDGKCFFEVILNFTMNVSILARSL
jgi:hypothetical protein